MTLRLFSALVALSLAGAANAMPVQTFLEKMDALQSKGAFAMFSGDLKVLIAQIKVDFAQLRADRLAAQAAHQQPAFCPTAGGIKMTNQDIRRAMEAVPQVDRAATDTREALKTYLSRRFPCRG
ncbi:MAG: hypothetical protein ACJ8FR_00975 [Sphingomonas sp.]